jgi:hypothetical protein
MALLLTEGFEDFGPNGTTGATLGTALVRRYEAYFSLPTPIYPTLNDGWGSGLALEWNKTSYSTQILTFKLPDEYPYLILGFAFRLTGNYIAENRGANPIIGLQYRNASAVGSHIMLYCDLNNVLSVYTSTTPIHSTSRPLRAGEWAYIEWKVRIHDTLGSSELKINGQVAGNASGIDTRQNTRDIAQVYFYGIQLVRLDDIYIKGDFAGSDTYCGPCKVETLRPTGDGATTGWTRSNANVAHYTLVDETPVNSSDYVVANASGDKELFSYPDTTAASIQAICINSDLANTLAGVVHIKPSYRSGDANSFAGTSIGIADTVTQLTREIFETDPNTNAAWTTTNFNSGQYGVEMV